MKWKKYRFDVVTRCIAGGANPAQQAEIRAPSLRGQLRWWFRLLGGFRSLDAQGSVKDQEGIIFGSASGRHGQAGLLSLRVSGLDNELAPVSNFKKDCDELKININSPEGYLLFPLRSNVKKGTYAGRAMFNNDNLPSFVMHVGLRDKSQIWPDIDALVAVLAHIGSLGMRSRRCMGALHSKEVMSLNDALSRFNQSDKIKIFSLKQDIADANDAVSKLALWLKNWRSYGRSPDVNDRSPGFKYVKKDHDLAVRNETRSDISNNEQSYRPALGLPIITKYGEWCFDFDQGKGKGRFASPILLRPYLSSDKNWSARVIFADPLVFPSNQKVFLKSKNRQAETVSVANDLYSNMRNDSELIQVWPVTHS